MNKTVLENRTKLLADFATEFGFFVAKNDIVDFIKRYEHKQLQASKQRVKEAKSALISEINNTVFSEIKAEMKNKKMTVADLARSTGKTHQQLSKMFKCERATVTTINTIKQAIESWKNN